MDAEAFATTKIRPPRSRPSLLPRPALESRLERALGEARLVLLAAPAGCGKTALLSRAIARLPQGSALAWVALDEDDSLRRVAHCLVAALEPWDLPWRSAPEALLQTVEGDADERLEAFVRALVHALAGSDVPLGLLVFDDLHRAADPALHRFLDSLVEQLPPPWTVAISSREEPSIALPRLRAAHALLELRQAELGFAEDEVRALVERHVDDPAACERLAAALHARTHGWAAGVSLLLGAGWRDAAPERARMTAQQDRHAFDFIASEILQRMPVALREFLLDCSVLEQLTDDSCRAVSGDPAASRWLDELERSALFVSVLDAEVRALRLHDLFRDALEDQLRRHQPERLSSLLRRAASIEHDPPRRIGLLLRAGDLDEAEREIAVLAPRLLTHGAIPELLRLVGQFPAGRRDSSPWLQEARTLAAWAQWDWSTMRETAARAVAGFERLGDTDSWRRARSYHAVALSGLDRDDEAQREVEALLAEPIADDVRCRVLLVAGWVALVSGRGADLARAWSDTVDALERVDRLATWYECSPLPSYIGLPGMREPLRRYVEGAWRRLPDRPVPLSGMLQVTLGWLQLLDADWSALGESLANAEAEDRWLGQPTNLHLQQLMLRAMGCALRGDASGARLAGDAMLATVEAMSSRAQRAAYVARLHYYAGRVAGVAGDLETLRDRHAQLEQHRLDPEWPLAECYREHLRAMVAQDDGDLATACDAWERALATRSRIDVYANAVEARLRLAAAWSRLGQADRARSQFEPAFERVRDSGGPGAALTAGVDALATLLIRAAQDDWPQAWIAALRRWHALAVESRPEPSATAQAAVELMRAAGEVGWGAWSDATASTAPVDEIRSPGPQANGPVPVPDSGPSSSTAIDPGSDPRMADAGLSPREVEVLERIAAGDSNKLIARAFDLSPHTVKRHVANILDKLGVESRGQAAAWLRGGPIAGHRAT